MASESLLTQFPYDNIALLWGATRYLCHRNPTQVAHGSLRHDYRVDRDRFILLCSIRNDWT
ncbi:hypothetical protein [Roseofilum capinflatum]|uniref:Uncharacterized protein n=1 Tax=Roseofilum capinflatum BLCC-M114 TaxID=3022440 RepID=A0ABT7BC74_9CYAN|nr:hypothetical protein [Roseofilum capinflatum]MDJ1176770.1 hypothetical protein [Roseofilum capinflatum BLCC-M114]